MKRAVLWALAGLAGTGALWASDLLASAGELSGTFTVAPLVIGLFAAAHSSGNFGLAWAPGLAHRLAAAASLFVLAFAQDQLGLRYQGSLVPRVILAGLMGLLAWQAFLSLRGLTRAPERRRLPAFFFIVLGVYAAVAPWSTSQRPPDGDEPYYLLLARSLAYDFDSDLANNYAAGDSLEFMDRRIGPQPGDPIGSEGEQFSRHNVLLPLLLAPFYRLAGPPGALAFMALIAAALAAVILRTAQTVFPEHPDETLWAASIAALSPPLLLQSHQVWVEVPAALLVALGFEAATNLRIEPNSRWRQTQVLVASLLLPLLKLRFLAVAFPLLAIAIPHVPSPQRRSLLRGSLLLMAAATAILLFNQVFFGRALKHHSTDSLLAYWTSPFDYALAPFGLFFDCAFGLLASAPIWFLALPGGWCLLRHRRAEIAAALVVCLPYLLLLGPRHQWYGGWSPFFRYGMVFLPFLTLCLVPSLAKRGSVARFVTTALGSLTACVTLVWLSIPGWTYNFANGRSYLLDHLSTILGADIVRLFPSAVRPRAANLIWLLLALLLAVWVVRSRRKAKRHELALGIAAILVASAILPLLAGHLRTRMVEFEDPHVAKTGGSAWPGRWVPNRSAYRGAWLLERGDQVSVRVRHPGTELALTLEVRRLGRRKRGTSLEVFAGDERMTLVTLPTAKGWMTLRLDPVAWPDRDRILRFRVVGEPGRILLDRARLEWR